jgi:carbon-monoxide dehydrogenase catalytic subunit
MILSQLLNWSLLCCEILCLKNLLCPPFVTGSQVAVNVLTEGLKDLTGGQLIIETEVDAAAQKFEDIIKEKRAGLGIDNGINKGGDAIC